MERNATIFRKSNTSCRVMQIHAAFAMAALPAPPVDNHSFSLRLAAEGERVRIVALKGGTGFREKLAGMGLWLGAEVQVLRNRSDRRLLLGHAEMRFFMGGGMAGKIQVVRIKGDEK